MLNVVAQKSDSEIITSLSKYWVVLTVVLVVVVREDIYAANFCPVLGSLGRTDCTRFIMFCVTQPAQSEICAIHTLYVIHTSSV